MKINSATQVRISGHVGKDPTIRQTKGGSVCSIRVAVSPKPDLTEWYQVTAWGELADTIFARVRSGDAIRVDGYLRLYSMPAKDKYPAKDCFEIVARRAGLFTNETDVTFFVTAPSERRPATLPK